MVPQIKDTSKRMSLIAGIAPVLEEALENFLEELEVNEAGD